MNEQKNIVILGAGISGLATGYLLKQKGYNVTVLEKSNYPGGSMISEQLDGYLIDYGPNSGLETTPVIKKLVNDVGLKDKMIYANEAGNKRYILKNDLLYPLPMNPKDFFKTKLFSTRAKLRLLAEPFIGKSKDGYYQSISDFVKRRLGKEFLDYAINPFVAGVYAGNPDKLSVKSAFPKLYRLEEVYGGLIKGMIKGAKERKKRDEKSKQDAKMFSFTNGMQSFPQAIAKYLDVNYSCDVKQVEKVNDKYRIIFIKDGESSELTTNLLLSTIPAYIAADVLRNLDNNLSEHLGKIYYPPVLNLFLGFKRKDIGQPLDGFGFLIPERERKSFLGAIWNSIIFEGRSEKENVAFTLFVGGARSPELFEIPTEVLISKVINEFKEIMQISSDPVLIKNRFWPKAIPQYNLGYIEHENYFDKFEKENPGIFLSGNYRGGISVGDCIKNSELVADKIDNVRIGKEREIS